MVGAGIFALLGQAGREAGSATWISFLIAGLVALLSGYSMARLGARFPAAGGIVEYLVQGYGVGALSGWMSLILYSAAVVSLSMLARAFGSYAAALVPGPDSRLLVDLLTAGITVLLVAVNLTGASTMARLERWFVLLKLVILALLTVAGAFYIRPELIAPGTYPSSLPILYSVAITFFGYEGFRVITNAAEDMPDPGRTLPRAMFTSIGIVIAIYAVVALTVFGNLPTEQAMAAKDYALAEAARPAFGQLGFVIVAIGALISTASSINANLYAVTNVTYQLAKDGELPSEFGKPIAHSREGLVVSGVAIVVLSVLLDLSEIAAIGSLLILIVHATVHVGHLRIIKQTGAAPTLVVLALLASAGTVCLAGYHSLRTAPHLIVVLAGVLIATGVAQLVLGRRRDILPRIKQV